MFCSNKAVLVVDYKAYQRCVSIQVADVLTLQVHNTDNDDKRFQTCGLHGSREANVRLVD